MTKGNDAKAPIWKRYAYGAAMACAGAVVGFGGGRFLWAGASGRTWSDQLSLMIALGLCSLGLLILAGRWIDPLGRLMTRSDLKRLDPLMKRLLGLQGVTLVLAGLCLGCVPLLAATAIRAAFEPALYGGLAVAFAIQTAVNVLLWRRGDEFHRRTMLETGALSFWVLQGALFLWAAAERLALVPALANWDLMAITMAVYLTLASLVAWRLGNS